MPVEALTALASAAGMLQNAFGNSGAGYSLAQQQLLNETQQNYARENANTEYAKQVQLTSLNPLLQKRGMVNAGINPSFVNGSSVGAASSVNSTAAPNAGSAPQNYDISDLFAKGANAVSAILQSSGIIADNKAKEAAAAKSYAEAEGQNILNTTLYQSAIARMNKDIAETRSTELKNVYQNIENSLHAQFGPSNAFLQNSILGSRASIESSDAAVRGVLNESTINRLDAEAQELKSRDLVNKSQRGVLDDTRLKLIPAQVRSLNAGATQAYAQAHLADNQAELSNSQKLAQDYQNAIYGDPDVQEASRKNLINLAKEAGPQSFGDYAWSVINDPNATTWQKWKAAGASILGFVERSLGGASEAAARNFADAKTSPKKEITTHTRVSPKGRTRLQKQVIRKIL